MDMRALLEPKKHGKARTKAGSNSLASSNHAHPSPPSTPSRSGTGSNAKPVNTSPTVARSYDPRALLNPRGPKASAKAAKMDVQNGPANGQMMGENGVTAQNNVNASTTGFNFLESLHGAEKRLEQRPAKKIKTEHEPADDDQKKESVNRSSRHGNAGVGEYFKPKPDPAVTGTTIPSASIDLTNEDDDDDGFEITGSRNLDDQEVCYGMVDGNVLAHKVPKPDKKITNFATNQWPVFKIVLRRVPNSTIRIECTDPYGVTFGTIGEELASALAPAMDGFPKLRVQCRMLTRTKKPNEWVHQDCSDRFKVIMNLYGRRADVQKIGRWFGQKNIWLKAPMVADAGIPVMNPHKDRRNNPQKVAATHQAVSTTRTTEETVDAVSKLFDYQSEEGNELAETEPPSLIVTTLLPHQKQALTFMLRQEQPRTFGSEEAGNSSLWRKKFDNQRRIVYEEVVAGLTVKEPPPESLGGLLADVMGLGKTIQALSLIASTASEATAFSQERLLKADEGEASLVCNSRATLLVAPVSTVKNWEDQIRDHTKSGSMMYHVYHGPNRCRNPFKLADNDVVITTYGTAGAEITGRGADAGDPSPLLKIRWFRVVLDEAHHIRESKSSQARAMYQLFSQRRWCLTGTPIQNRIADLGSLTIFLRLYPYDSVARFNQYIQAPAQSGDPGFLKRLRVFVDSFTLRRLRDRIDLPERQDVIVGLELSKEERALHDFFREMFSVVVKDMARQSKGTGSQYHRVLKGITILRLICDHGRELLNEEQLAEYKGSVPEDPVDLEQEKPPADITKRRAYEHFSMMAEADADMCAQCLRRFGGESPSSDLRESPNEPVSAVVLPCLDVLCTECFEAYHAAFEAARIAGESVVCEQCLMTMSPQYIPIPKTYAEELQAVPEETTMVKNNLFKNGYYTGPHTKTKALLEDITTMNEESMPLVEAGEPPLKCVVFSEFTSHLDLIQKALDDNGHTYVRIDGSMSLSQRRKVLDALNTDTSVTILLASIKAAGQGLNLTAASRAFIMEPMWNPAAEAQAVDRIYRIGQKRAVIVKRYRIISSIEDKIVQLQDKKKKLAEMSMEKTAMRKALGKKERGEESLKAMLDIFKA
ncbi:hypothetical protein PMZ80_007235 [Knufia obscura]|uniref:Uncharacterized protein n=2 Tax=Knufia TaxID=430999 RepID=A0AAN8EFZ7_9EURO|nr:hypothetical protein PMZ80_007235 [Knufia obscura]KAK5953245.1 hypothetical protein OHC33_005813 [Knufia fluminis]